MQAAQTGEDRTGFAPAVAVGEHSPLPEIRNVSQVSVEVRMAGEEDNMTSRTVKRI